MAAIWMWELHSRAAISFSHDLLDSLKLLLSQYAHISTSTIDYDTSTHIFLETDHLCTMLTNIGLFATVSM